MGRVDTNKYYGQSSYRPSTHTVHRNSHWGPFANAMKSRSPTSFYLYPAVCSLLSTGPSAEHSILGMQLIELSGLILRVTGWGCVRSCRCCILKIC